MLNRILSAAAIASVAIIVFSYVSSDWSWWYDMPKPTRFRSGNYWEAFFGRAVVAALFLIGMIIDPFIQVTNLPKIKVQVDKS